MKAMKWIRVLVFGAATLAGVVTAIGASLPREHTASRSLLVHRPATAVWTAISDFRAAPSWRKDVRSVERGPDRNGHPVWIEQGANGTLPMEVVEADAPSKLVTRIADPNLPFGGTWTYRVEPGPGGSTRLTITEEGWVSNPIFRFVSRVVLGRYATIDAYLNSLAKKFADASSALTARLDMLIV